MSGVLFYFKILYYDQEIHNYFTTYHTPTCFHTIVSSFPSYTSISNAAAGNKICN